MIFRVKLKTGEIFALDLSGAQFGYFETVIPWIPYLESRTGHKSENGLVFRTFGNSLRTAQEILSTSKLFETLDVADLVSGHGSLFQMTMKFNVDFSKEAWSACEKFGLTQAKRPLEEMLKLPHMAFEQMRNQLVSYVGQELVGFKAAREKKGGFFKVVAVDPVNNSARVMKDPVS